MHSGERLDNNTMTGSVYKQLSPFELKFAVTELLNKINSVNDIQNCLAEFEMLEAQKDKNVLAKILFKELSGADTKKIPVICFMLEHYLPKDELINKLWAALKNSNLQTEAKITILNLLRDLDSDWSYETCEEYLKDDAKSLLDENTKHLLNVAVINPEVQIDFLDFMATIRTNDKITLLNSLDEDFTSDAMANILIPVFMSEPDSPEGLEALKLLAHTKSQLALHALEEMKNYASGEVLQEIKRSLSTIKLSGMRIDNTKEFYKKILSDSSPHKFYVTYPDGHGNIAMIFTRLTENKKIRFVSIVTNIETGIKDCFGFFEISEFEYSKILERFLRDEKTVDITPEAFRTILYNAELATVQKTGNNWKFPYEYVCWRNLLIDIDFDPQKIEEILKEKVSPLQITGSIASKLEELRISSRWFLDMDYSNEFTKILKMIKTAGNLDELVNNHWESVFDEAEKTEWKKKILFSAYIKFAIGKEDDAGFVYGILFSEQAQAVLFKEILKRSIYEYLMVVKYDKSVNSYDLTHEEINDKINYIEEKWVDNV